VPCLLDACLNVSVFNVCCHMFSLCVVVVLLSTTEKTVSDRKSGRKQFFVFL
jgi:hypothetical protein